MRHIDTSDLKRRLQSIIDEPSPEAVSSFMKHLQLRIACKHDDIRELKEFQQKLINLMLDLK